MLLDEISSWDDALINHGYYRTIGSATVREEKKMAKLTVEELNKLLNSKHEQSIIELLCRESWNQFFDTDWYDARNDDNCRTADWMYMINKVLEISGHLIEVKNQVEFFKHDIPDTEEKDDAK